MTDTIKKAAEKFPEKAAFRFSKDSITYEELLNRVNQTASVLIENGVKRGDRIGVFLKPCLETAIAIYGIMNAGAVYVPIDTNSPTKRVSYLINDCEIKHLISNQNQSSSLKKLLDGNVQLESIIGISEDFPIQTISWQEVFQSSDKEVSVRVLEDDLAYVMYTSGTTGVPKGIMHSHHSGLNYAKLSRDLYQVNSEDILANHSPLHFDISTFGYFTMPIACGTTVLISEAYKNFPTSLSKLIEDEKITIWYSVPLALTQMLQRGSLDKRNLKSLRWILFGGEPFSPKHLRELMKILPRAEFSNVYGPAEVNQCTFYNFKELPTNTESIPLGKAWGNTEIIIVDENDQEVKQGEVGELLVRTATMMKGYWGQLELTNKSLYKRERISSCEEVFYRTGDLAKENAVGDLMFMGRKDRQIKIRGYRIELDEIESVLTTHASVNEVAVYTFKNGEDELSIAATIVPNSNSEVSENDFREQIGRHLPQYVVLNKINVSNSLPRTSAGKVDHKKLAKQATEVYNK